MKFNILVVDDDVNALSGYKRSLRNNYSVSTASSAMEGLALLKKDSNFSVIISDYSMPQMDGIQFLSYVKDIVPDSIRIMLTGYADLSTAMNAVNEGNIFRFLTKPCPRETLLKIVEAGIEQYKLITAEKELLAKTLKGSIKVLADILAIVNPQAFSKSSRIRKLVKGMGEKLGVKKMWELEIAALLSQIGCVAVPADVLDKFNSGEDLSEKEESIFSSHPSIGASLLSNIPRLEKVAQIIKFQSIEGPVNQEEIPLTAKIIQIVNRYDDLEVKFNSSDKAYEKLKTESDNFDPIILTALDAEIAGIYDGLVIRSVNINDLQNGEVLAEDIKDSVGSVLITKGSEITDISKMRLLNYLKLQQIDQPVKILST